MQLICTRRSRLQIIDRGCYGTYFVQHFLSLGSERERAPPAPIFLLLVAFARRDMMTIKDRLAEVPLSVDGKSIGLYALAAAVSGMPPSEGKAVWFSTVQRLKTRKLPCPLSTKGKVAGNKQVTPLIRPQHAPEAVRAVLLEPPIFFRDDGCKDALKKTAGQDWDRGRLRR